MMAGNPIKMTGLADPVDRRAAPDLDSSRDAILREFARNAGCNKGEPL